MPIQHGIIDDPFIHEPRGIGTATIGKVYVSDGAGSGDWTEIKDAVFPFTADVFTEYYIPSNRMVLPGAASDPGREATSGSLLFDQTAQEIVYISVPVPRDRKATGDLKVYALWSKTTSAANDVQWLCDYKIGNIAAVLAGSWTNLATEDTPLTTDDGTADKIMLTSLSALDLTSLTNDMFIDLRISRTSATSNYAADARLHGILITYTVADIGDTDEFAP